MILKKKNQSILLCTNRKSRKKNVRKFNHESKTIHRLLQYNPGTGGFIHNKNYPLECDVLIIDESSMIDVAIMPIVLMNAVPLHSAVVFVGDIDQLPSVGPGKVLQDIILSKQLPLYHI